MAPTVLMLADALGLQHMPSQLYSNHGHGKPQHDGEMWSAAGFKTTRATRDAKTAAQPLLAASNDCSIALYKKWLYKFDQRVREQPTSFHARMASVPTTRPKMRARDPSGDNLGRPRSGRQAQASDEPGSNEAAAVRIELAETQQRLAAAHKESALLQRELAGAMVSNERLQDNLRLVAKSRKRDSLMPALPAPPPPAVSCADASTQAEAVAVLPGNNIGEGTALPKVESVAVAEGAATAEVPTGLDSEFDSVEKKDAFASADLIAELETELEKLRVSAKSSSELAQAAESRALEADERAEKTREDSLLAQTDFKSAANEAQEAIATLEAQLLAVRSQVTDAEVAAFAEYTQLAAREFKNSELATRLEAEAAEHRAALDLAEASAVLSMADAEAAVVEAEEAREALMSAQAEANESKALLAEIGSSNALAEAAKCAAEEEATLRLETRTCVENLISRLELDSATESAEVAMEAIETAQAEAEVARVEAKNAVECAMKEAAEAVAEREALAARLGAELARWRSQAEELAEYAAMEAEAASLSGAEVAAVETALGTAKIAATSLGELELEVSDLAINAADLLEHLGAAERQAAIQCDELGNTLADAHMRLGMAVADAEEQRAAVDVARADADDARESVKAAELALEEAKYDGTQREILLGDKALELASELDNARKRALEAETRAAKLDERLAQCEQAVIGATDAGRAQLVAVRELAEANARDARAEASVRERSLSDALAAVEDAMSDALTDASEGRARCVALQEAMGVSVRAHETALDEMRESHSSERQTIELRARARATAASSLANVGLPMGSTRVIAVASTPSALATAAGGSFSLSSRLDGAASGGRSSDMFQMRSALSDAKRRLAQQRERMKEHGILSP
mmetsp:Transcript_29485/g.69020  ORF Transcript_29485/g.69020 Transcript_29485/m.69020 type:complete len:880 (+) Transcript_29485:1299-3938(+)